MLTFKGKGSHRIETPKSRERKSFQVVVVGKNSTLNAGDLRDMGLFPGWEDPLEEDMATHSSVLPGESHGQRNISGCSP